MGAFCCTFFYQDSPLSSPGPHPLSFQTLAHFFAIIKISTLLFSSDSAVFVQHTRRGASTPRADAYDPRSANKKRVCRIRYLSGGSASNVLLEPAGHSAKLSPGPGSVVSNCLGGCDGEAFS